VNHSAISPTSIPLQRLSIVGRQHMSHHRAGVPEALAVNDLGLQTFPKECDTQKAFRATDKPILRDTSQQIG